jgi:hypothetical protein
LGKTSRASDLLSALKGRGFLLMTYRALLVHALFNVQAAGELFALKLLQAS